MPRPATIHKWTELPTDTPMPLLERQRIIGDKMMISRVLLKKGCDIPTHAHENEQFALVMSGKVRFGLGNPGAPDRREVILGAGDVLELPAHVPHSAFAIEETLILDMFSPVSQKTGIDRK